MIRLLPLAAALLLAACAAHPRDTARQPLPGSQPVTVSPAAASQNKPAGVVKFTFDIDEEGRLINIHITESTPDHLFDDAVIKGVSTWRYEKGKPAKNRHMTVVFRRKEE